MRFLAFCVNSLLVAQSDLCSGMCSIYSLFGLECSQPAAPSPYPTLFTPKRWERLPSYSRDDYVRVNCNSFLVLVKFCLCEPWRSHDNLTYIFKYYYINCIIWFTMYLFFSIQALNRGMPVTESGIIMGKIKSWRLYSFYLMWLLHEIYWRVKEVTFARPLLSNRGKKAALM